MTFSIVAYSPDEASFGIGVPSKFLGVGAIVPWARAGAGAIATQAFANYTYGPNGLDLLAQGHSAEEALRALVDPDPMAAQRQIGIVDSQGRVAAHTGTECLHYAGHRLGDGFACQGNILAG